jgi:hypothetical protein
MVQQAASRVIHPCFYVIVPMLPCYIVLFGPLCDIICKFDGFFDGADVKIDVNDELFNIFIKVL